MVKRFANRGDPDQTPQSVASDLGLHCLPITILRSPGYNGLMNSHNVRFYGEIRQIYIFGHSSVFC